jgi:hypothetical protein
MRRLRVIVAAMLVGLGASLAAGDAWILWTHTVHEFRGDEHHQWSKSAAFEDRQHCVEEQQRRQKESLARQCRNIWTDAVIPDCKSVSAEGPTGVKYRFKRGSQLATYWTCWPAGEAPRR